MGLPENLKLLQVSSSLEARLGGPTNVVQHTTKYLKATFNHELLIFGRCQQDFADLVIPTLFNNRYGFTIRKRNSAKNLINSSDVILVHGFYLYSTLFTLSLAEKKHVYVMPHGSLEPYGARTGKTRKVLFEWIFKYLSQNRKVHFVCASKQELVHLQSKFPDFPIELIGIGVEIPDANLTSTKRVPSLTVKMSCISRLDRIKRIDLCIRAIPILLSKGYDVELHIAGGKSGALYRELLELCEILGVSDRVFFVGFLNAEEKEDLLLHSKIFLLTSENENFSVATAEAIAFHVPVIVGPNVGMCDFVETFKTGKVLAELSEFDLAEGVIEILQDYDNLEQNCKDNAFRLGWDVVFEKWIEVFSRLRGSV